MSESESRMPAEGQWVREIEDVVRGAAGGMLIGIPLLYTMEVWWIGSYTGPERMLAVLLFTFVPVFLLNRTSGFRSSKDVRLVDAAVDTVEAVALGILCVTGVLVLLREITMTTPLAEAAGKVVYEALPFSLGVSLARHFLERSRDEGDESNEGDESDEGDGEEANAEGAPDTGLNATMSDVGATVIGSVFIAFNIAPTDEIPMLAAATSPSWLLAILAASLLISYCIVFEAGFSSQAKRRHQQGWFQRPLTETVVCYLVSLISAGFMLWIFQNLRLDAPWSLTVSHVVILGLPAAVGGAAGRLAV
ncbi:MAG TPA: TIGR02587 family membrane protein [Acidimicrobiales bacterium]|nr:TIGR02587 family membrane protein [Acidimicrobiales bacterium]